MLNRAISKNTTQSGWRWGRSRRKRSILLILLTVLLSVAAKRGRAIADVTVFMLADHDVGRTVSATNISPHITCKCKYISNGSKSNIISEFGGNSKSLLVLLLPRSESSVCVCQCPAGFLFLKGREGDFWIVLPSCLEI